jgi:hypothetical protein
VPPPPDADVIVKVSENACEKDPALLVAVPVFVAVKFKKAEIGGVSPEPASIAEISTGAFVIESVVVAFGLPTLVAVIVFVVPVWPKTIMTAALA